MFLVFKFKKTWHIRLNLIDFRQKSTFCLLKTEFLKGQKTVCKKSGHATQ